MFICNPWLASAILTLRKEYCEFQGISFIDDTTAKQNFEVFYFIEAQMAAFEACKNVLTDFRNSTAEVLCNLWPNRRQNRSLNNMKLKLQLMRAIQQLQRKVFNRLMKHWFLPLKRRSVKWLAATFTELKRDVFVFYSQSIEKSSQKSSLGYNLRGELSPRTTDFPKSMLLHKWQKVTLDRWIYHSEFSKSSYEKIWRILGKDEILDFSAKVSLFAFLQGNHLS